jgi:hypothetical protein
MRRFFFFASILSIMPLFYIRVRLKRTVLFFYCIHIGFRPLSIELWLLLLCAMGFIHGEDPICRDHGEGE